MKYHTQEIDYKTYNTLYFKPSYLSIYLSILYTYIEKHILPKIDSSILVLVAFGK